MSMKNPNETIGYRSRDLPVCSAGNKLYSTKLLLLLLLLLLLVLLLLLFVALKPSYDVTKRRIYGRRHSAIKRIQTRDVSN
jgi:hypothetical protein